MVWVCVSVAHESRPTNCVGPASCPSSPLCPSMPSRPSMPSDASHGSNSIDGGDGDASRIAAAIGRPRFLASHRSRRCESVTMQNHCWADTMVRRRRTEALRCHCHRAFSSACDLWRVDFETRFSLAARTIAVIGRSPFCAVWLCNGMCGILFPIPGADSLCRRHGICLWCEFCLKRVQGKI